MASSSRDHKHKSSSNKEKKDNHNRDYEKKENKEYEMKHDDHDKGKDQFENKHHDAEVEQDANQYSATIQESNELIFVKDSCNIKVHSTDTQAAVSLQIGLQLAIALVIRITIGDSPKGESVVQDLLQHFDSVQSNKQKIIIENSKDITVTTTDTDIAVNIQALLQVLLTLVAELDVL
jgi:spore coat protein X